MKIFNSSNLTPIEQHTFEVVERKGIGHPDTLADGIAESISLAYSQYCRDHFGVILHHNVDKTAVFGGLAEVDFGVGRMVKPHRLILSGRMSREFAGTRIDYEALQRQAAEDWLSQTLPYLEQDRWLEVHSFTSSSSRNPTWFHPRGVDDVPDAKRPWANDTSVCVGYWPLSLTEQLALSLEGYFYKEGRPVYDFIGQDIKVMAVRNRDGLEVTMCVPCLAQRVPTSKFYWARMSELQQGLLERAKQVTRDRYRISLFINTEDQRATDARGHYFVCSGSALDFGEEGMVGRGNRSRGVISSIRPYSMEASNGKNPVYHVGKVYGYIVDVLSKQIAETFGCECQLAVATRNGDPLYDPHQVFVRVSKAIDEVAVQALIERELTTRPWTNEILSDQPFLPKAGGGHGVTL